MPEKKFTKVENFPPKVENFRLCRMFQFMWFWNIYFFFRNFFEVKNFHLFHLGWNLANEKVQKPKKISKWKIFHQNWINFHLCRMFQFMWFCKKIMSFRNWKISSKVERIPLSLIVSMGLNIWTFFPLCWKNFPLRKIFIPKSHELEHSAEVEIFPLLVENFPLGQNYFLFIRTYKYAQLHPE